MTKMLEDGRLDLVRKIRALPPKRRRALIALLKQRGVDLSALDTIPSASRASGEPVQLSFTQQRLWFLAQLDGTSVAYNIPIAMRLRGRLDRAALLRALEGVVERHEALRTRFVERDGVPYQHIGDGRDFVVREEELVDPAELPLICEREVATPFDLERDSLIRVRLLRQAEQEHVLLVTMHHGVSDGWSVGVFVRDVVALYEAFHAGRPSPLEPLDIQYADYAQWQRQWLDGGVRARQVEYWKTQLAGVDPRLSLPADRARPPSKTYQGAREAIRCPLERLDRLREVAKQHDVTLYMTLLAAYAIVLHRYTGQTDIAVGTVVANRPRLEAEPLIGFFANTLVMRTDLSGDPTFPELLARVKKTALEAYDHQDVPFEAVVDALQIERLLSHSPVFQTMFVLQEAQTERETRVGELVVSAVEFDPKMTKFDVTVELCETPDGLVGTVEYNTDLFERETIQRFIGHYTELLASIAHDPTARTSRLGMVGEAERRRVVETWNDTRRAYSHDRCLHQLFEDAAKRHPERTALVDGDRGWSYAELDAWANRIAHRLRHHGVGPDTPVGLYAERSAEMVAGIMGTLKAGGAYMPMEPSYPAARIAEIIDGSRVGVVLTQPHLDPGPLGGVPKVLALHRDGRVSDLDGRTEPTRPEHDLPVADPGLGARHLAYVIHTSGSTGRPKGVMIEHRAAVNRIEWMHDEYRLTEDDVVLQKTPFSFDVSVWEFFWPLLFGARLAVAEPEGHKDPSYLVSAIQRFGVTTLHFVPSMFRSIVEEPGWSRCTSVRQVFCSGEALPPDLCVRHYERHTAALHNLYGPTEAAVDVSYWAVPDDRSLHAVPIGRPIQNIQLYVLDQALQPQGIGCVGELFIAGDGLARGYLHRPELTRERFVPNPLCDDPSARMYRTGDLARWLPDGTLMYLGRVDDQIKLRGFRIELGEIEHRLTEHPAVRSCAVVVREDQPGNPQLVAYAVLEDEPTLADHRTELAGHLGRTLPEYMVPRAFVVLDALPVTANGKLDRKALPAPGLDAYAQRTYVAPSTETEQRLASLWAELLRVDEAQISAEDSFFALGGHSLLIPVLVAKLRERGLRATVRAVFSAPTLAALAAEIDGAESEPDYTAPPNLIPPGCKRITPGMLPLIDLSHEQIDAIVATVPGGAPNVQDVYPLVSTQEGILFHHLMDPDHDPYLVSTLFVAEDEVACARFVDAVQAMVDRHDAWRTAVLTSDVPEPVQVVYRTARLAVERIGLDPNEDAEAQARALLEQPRRMPLDRAPLLRLLVADDPRSGQRYLVLTAHHLIEDATSLRLTLDELAVHMAGRADRLPPPAPYRDFVAHTLHQQASSDVEAYFRAALGDVTEPTTPFGLANVRGDARRVRQLRRSLPAGLTDEIRAQAQRLRISPACLFHAAWACVTSACSGRPDVVFGTVMSGRLQGVPGVERMLGNFINTLPMRVQLAGKTVRDLIADVDVGLKELVAREHSPLSVAQRCSGLDGDAPLFSAVANFRHFEAGDANAAPRIDDHGVRFVAAADGINYPVSVSLDDFGSELSLDLLVDDAVPCEAVAGYVEAAMSGIVRALAADDGMGTKALDIDVLPAVVRQRLLSEWSGEVVDVAAKTLMAAFEAQVDRSPDRVALIFEGRTLSYAELDARANRLARWLIARGAAPGRLVAVRIPRSFALVTAIYGVLKSGAAYLPIDTELPAERVAQILDDSTPLLVLEDLPDTSSLPSTRPVVAISGEDTAYVLYTSGSTGRPKGVVISHRASMNWLAWDHGHYGMDGSHRMLLKTSVGFDVSVSELFWPLQVGASVVIARPGGHKDLAYLAELIREQHVTDVNFVPSALAAFLCEPSAAQCTTLRRVEAAGEALPVELAEQLTRILPGVELHNLYGPTEVGGVTAWQYRAEPTATGVPIGRPVWNTQAYVLDSMLRLVPPEAPGELYLAGAQLAHGYLNRPSLTNERFVPNPFVPGARMYRTGDLVKWRPDGVLDYLGRIDDQLKVRGFRVEPGEIEHALHAHASVHKAVVVPRAFGEVQALVAYVQPTSEWLAAAGQGSRASSDPSLVRALRDHLSKRLPDYMVPHAFVLLEDFPLTRNGKVDKRALPTPSEDDLVQEAYVAPQTEDQRTLCRIIQDVLGLGRVGLRSTFFDLGGDSLLATRLTLRVKKEMGMELPLQQILGGATVEQMAAGLRKEPAAPPHVPLVPSADARDGEEAPLSLQQADLWFLGWPEHLGTSCDNIQMAFRIEGLLDRDACVRSVQALVGRHAVLRTSYVRRNGSVTQRVNDDAAVAVTVMEVGDEAAVAEWLPAERVRPFAPSDRHMLRVHLLALSDRDHVLVVTRPWGIFDGWSVRIVLSELLALYQALSRGHEPSLPPLPLQYADFARWQRRVVDRAELDRQQAYWRRQLAGLPACASLRTDHRRGSVKSYQGSSVELRVPPEVLASLRQVGQERGASLYMTLLSAFAVLVRGYSDDHELAIGSPVTNRPMAELESLVGYFVNTLVLRLSVSPDRTFTELLGQARRVTAEAHEHKDLPFVDVVRALVPQPDPACSPLFQVMFNLLPAPVPDAGEPTEPSTSPPMDLKVHTMHSQSGSTRYDLDLVVQETASGLHGSLAYSADVFARSTVERMARSYERLLAKIAVDPEGEVARLWSWACSSDASVREGECSQ